jgi:hypothetical protein
MTLETLLDKLPKFITTYEDTYYLLIGWFDGIWFVGYKTSLTNKSYQLLGGYNCYKSKDLKHVLETVISALKNEGIIR